MTFITFDTETTGLPRSFKCQADETTLKCWDGCRLVQIAWRVYNDHDSLISSQCRLVQPAGFEIPGDATAIHGISTESAMLHGAPIQDILAEFMEVVAGVDDLVAHNISFDDNVIRSEMIRCGMDLAMWETKTRVCTMLGNKHLFGGRWLKLAAMYARLVGPVPEHLRLHSADADCRLCADIYIRSKHL